MAQSIDRALITDLLQRYCRGVDSGDMEMVRNTFWPDGSDNHAGFYSGSIDGIIPTMTVMRARLLTTMHALASISIEVVGDTAMAE